MGRGWGGGEGGGRGGGGGRSGGGRVEQDGKGRLSPRTPPGRPCAFPPRRPGCVHSACPLGPPGLKQPGLVQAPGDPVQTSSGHREPGSAGARGVPRASTAAPDPAHSPPTTSPHPRGTRPGRQGSLSPSARPSRPRAALPPAGASSSTLDSLAWRLHEQREGRAGRPRPPAAERGRPRPSAQAARGPRRPQLWPRPCPRRPASRSARRPGGPPRAAAGWALGCRPPAEPPAPCARPPYLPSGCAPPLRTLRATGPGPAWSAPAGVPPQAGRPPARPGYKSAGQGAGRGGRAGRRRPGRGEGGGREDGRRGGPSRKAAPHPPRSRVGPESRAALRQTGFRETSRSNG